MRPVALWNEMSLPSLPSHSPIRAASGPHALVSVMARSIHAEPARNARTPQSVTTRHMASRRFAGFPAAACSLLEPCAMRNIDHVLASLVAAGVLLLGRTALADTATGRDPDAHPHYFFEAEPHALVGLYEPRAFGAGFRGTFILSDSGFIRGVNDTV